MVAPKYVRDPYKVLPFYRRLAAKYLARFAAFKGELSPLMVSIGSSNLSLSSVEEAVSSLVKSLFPFQGFDDDIDQTIRRAFDWGLQTSVNEIYKTSKAMADSQSVAYKDASPSVSMQAIKDNLLSTLKNKPEYNTVWITNGNVLKMDINRILSLLRNSFPNVMFSVLASSFQSDTGGTIAQRMTRINPEYSRVLNSYIDRQYYSVIDRLIYYAMVKSTIEGKLFGIRWASL